MRRIECGGGEDGEPVLSSPSWKSYASRVSCAGALAHDCGGMSKVIGAAYRASACPRGTIRTSC